MASEQSHAPRPRVCEHCGSDTYKAEHFDRVRDRLTATRDRWEALARDNGLLRAKLEVAEMEAKETQAGLQRKVSRQARVIRRMEERLRRLGARPHEGETPGDASPVEGSS